MEKHPNYLEYRKIFDQVVRDILEGKLDHDQTEWHCGTAHCVRGWFEVKASKHFYNQDYDPITGMFVNADGTVQQQPAIFTIIPSTKITNTEKVAYLTGYDEAILTQLFQGRNTLYLIAELATRLGIDLSTTTISSNVNPLNQIANVQPIVVRVTGFS